MKSGSWEKLYRKYDNDMPYLTGPHHDEEKLIFICAKFKDADQLFGFVPTNYALE